MLELRNLTRSFGETRAVDGLNLTVESSEVRVLIGPSGCGKSTTLRLVMGLLEPDDGTVLLDGARIQLDDQTALRQQRRKIGYVIQGGGLFPHLTARKNITLMARHLNWAESRIERRLDELIAMTRFPRDGLNRYPSGLSGGQKQRVSLMRALLLDPEVLLMDEPLGALDPMIRAELQDELDSIFEELDKTVLLVTHDLDEAAFFGDQIALMKNGRIVQRGRLKELIDRPADEFVTDFIRAQRSHLDELKP